MKPQIYMSPFYPATKTISADGFVKPVSDS